MRETPSYLRQAIRRLERPRSVQVRKILAERGPLRAGSFVPLRRKCGKPNCHCAEGEGHPTYYLSIKEAGRTRMIYVPRSQADLVRRQTERYRGLRRRRAMLVTLFGQALELIDRLERALETQEDISVRKSARSSWPKANK